MYEFFKLSIASCNKSIFKKITKKYFSNETFPNELFTKFSIFTRYILNFCLLPNLMKIFCKFPFFNPQTLQNFYFFHPTSPMRNFPSIFHTYQCKKQTKDDNELHDNFIYFCLLFPKKFHKSLMIFKI